MTAIIEFSPFRLEIDEERLRQGSTDVSLRPRTLAVLQYLAERAGKLVRHDELLGAVWGDAAVTPGTLNTSIRELRKALGDDARQPRYIETVFRKGFRFVAAVNSVEQAALRAGDSASPRAASIVSAPGMLHGRGGSLQQLEACLDVARRGTRQVVFATGEIGIGKTSLLRAFLDQHSKEEVEGSLRVAWGQSVHRHGQGEAYHPVLEALDRLIRSQDTELLRSTLRRYAPTWLLQLPWLLEPGEAEELHRELGNATSDRMLREFCVAIEQLTREQPLIFVLEDLHWADSATVDLLGALAERADPARLLLIGTYRPVDAAIHDHPIAPLRRSLQRHGVASELQLAGLTEANVESYLCERFGWETAPSALATAIQNHTDGNPLFMVTLSGHLVANGMISESNGAWRLVATLDSLASVAPESLTQIVEDQLRNLGAEVREMLEAASVVGDSFAAQAVAAALEAEVEAVERIFGLLERRGQFVQERGVAAWPDGSQGRLYEFQHAVFRQVLYGQISPARRQQLHLFIGERIEAAHPADLKELGAELAAHFEQAGDLPRTVTHLRRAAAFAQQRFSHRQAADYLHQALDLRAHASENEDRRALPEFALRSELTRSLIISVGWGADEVLENVIRCLDLSRQLGHVDSEAAALERLTRVHNMRSEFSKAQRSLDQLKSVAPTASFISLPGVMAQLSAQIHLVAGEFDRVEQAIAEALSGEYDDKDLLVAVGPHPLSMALCIGSLRSWIAGRVGDACSRIARACEEAGRFGETISLVVAHVYHAGLARELGDVGQAREAIEAFNRESESSGLVLPSSYLYAVEAWLLIERGDSEAAVSFLRERLAAVRRGGMTIYSTAAFVVLAEALLARGDAEQGLDSIEEAFQYANDTGERMYEAEFHRLRGDLLLLREDPAVAEASFRAAIAVARTQGARSFELRAATALARIHGEQNKTEQAIGDLETVLSSIDGGSNTRDILSARALLRLLRA